MKSTPRSAASATQSRIGLASFRPALGVALASEVAEDEVPRRPQAVAGLVARRAQFIASKDRAAPATLCAAALRLRPFNACFSNLIARESPDLARSDVRTKNAVFKASATMKLGPPRRRPTSMASAGSSIVRHERVRGQHTKAHAVLEDGAHQREFLVSFGCTRSWAKQALIEVDISVGAAQRADRQMAEGEAQPACLALVLSQRRVGTSRRTALRQRRLPIEPGVDQIGHAAFTWTVRCDAADSQRGCEPRPGNPDGVGYRALSLNAQVPSAGLYPTE